VSRGLREAVADWLMLLGAVVLALSLFMAWSHQRQVTGAVTQAGFPRDPTGWQVYSAADVMLAALAIGLVYVSFLGTRAARAIVLAPVALALAFVVHALSVPPTNGVLVSTAVPPGSGAGEVVAIVGLVVAMAGLGLSFTAD
jgi:hypothetical protein